MRSAAADGTGVLERVGGNVRKKLKFNQLALGPY